MRRSCLEGTEETRALIRRRLASESTTDGNGGGAKKSEECGIRVSIASKLRKLLRLRNDFRNEREAG